MPCYDFICKTCETPIEAWLNFEEIDRMVKPNCSNCNNSDNVFRNWATGSPHIKKYNGNMAPSQINGQRI